MKRGGATIEGYTVLDAAICRKTLFEGGHRRPQDKLSTIDNTKYCRIDLRLYLPVLFLQIKKPYQGSVLSKALEMSAKNSTISDFASSANADGPSFLAQPAPDRCLVVFLSLASVSIWHGSVSFMDPIEIITSPSASSGGP